MVSRFVTSPFDHSRIWSGLASEMRIALKLLTSRMVLLRVAGWLGEAIPNVCDRRQAERAPAPRAGRREGGGLGCLEVDVNGAQVRGMVQLESVGGCGGRRGLHLHLQESLAALLSLVTQRLIGSEAVCGGRASMDIMLEEMMERAHVVVPEG